jgi:hypothetical protein
MITVINNTISDDSDDYDVDNYALCVLRLQLAWIES